MTDMTESKRKRGRPPGTGRKDGPTLRAMAALMAENSGLRPTTAIRRVLSAPGDADVRRLQVKWKDCGAVMMKEALAARKAREEIRRQRRAADFEQRVRDQAEAVARFTSALVGGLSPAVRAARALQEGSAMRAAQDLYDSPAMRAAREFQESPSMRAIRELQDGPAMSAAQALMKARLGKI